MEKLIEKWPSKIFETCIGAAKEEGGTRSNTVKVGGEHFFNLLMHGYKYLSSFRRNRSRASCRREVTVVTGMPAVWAISA